MSALIFLYSGLHSIMKWLGESCVVRLLLGILFKRDLFMWIFNEGIILNIEFPKYLIVLCVTHSVCTLKIHTKPINNWLFKFTDLFPRLVLACICSHSKRILTFSYRFCSVAIFLVKFFFLLHFFRLFICPYLEWFSL